MYPSRNPPDLATKYESAQEFLEELDNDEDPVTPLDEAGNDDTTGGDDINQPDPNRYYTGTRRSPTLFDPDT
eukprot:13345894-Ditylum_brightwellii.AAC.1